MRGRRGAFLPLVLVALLLTGGMTVFSFALVETITETVRFRVDDELLMSAAVSGIERGKMLLEEKFTSASVPPQRREPASTLSVEDLSPPFSALLIEGCEDRFFIDPPGAEVMVTVYD
ncbi:MAG: hypothetical protein EOM12_12490, partial [Verrucomicrobiae bacterium]|nr:hypothetical protein [Verrucomicrobiae bacterium]